jgi:hypothetical protein
MIILGIVQVQMEMEKAEDNYFKILGLDRDALTADVKRAYRKLSLEIHPDKHGIAEKDVMEKKFQMLQQAHETLVNDITRDVYDRWGRTGLKWLERNESVVLNGLAATVVSVVAAFVGAYITSMVYSKTNAHVWNFGALAIITALVFGMRFGDEDFPPKWFPYTSSLTRHEKCNMLWTAFTPYCTAVVAIQRVVGITFDQLVDSKLNILLQQTMMLLEEVKKKKSGNATTTTTTSTPSSTTNVGLNTRSKAVLHNKDNHKESDTSKPVDQQPSSSQNQPDIVQLHQQMLQHQHQQQQQSNQPSSILSRIPIWAWIFIISTVFSWFGSSKE